jgi:pimeloyl-ACP methyl ester carboxylesterase
MAHSYLDLTASGLTFSGLAWGEHGGATVLCLHGFPQRSTSWTGVAGRLADTGLRVVALDQRGYSPAARPADVAAYALPNLVADAVGMIEALGAPVHLVGHDWGGVVGWHLAARRPELVRSWTAVSTTNPTALNEVLARDAEQRERFAYMRFFRLEGIAEEKLLADGGRRLKAMYGGHVDARRVAEDVAFFAQPGVLTAALSWYRAMSRDDGAGLPRMTVPTSYVWGSEDLAFGREAAELSGDYVDAPYRFVPLEGASHWLPDEVPDTLAEVISERIASVPPSAGADA